MGQKETRASIIWFDTITEFIFANEVIDKKQSREKKPSRTESTQEIPDENCTRGKEKLETEAKSRDRSHVMEARWKDFTENELRS